jgi:predicted DNA-binding transcriptional regulator AlpA
MWAQAPSLRPAAAAFVLGISEATLWNWLKTRHDMPRPRRPSTRCTLFDKTELLAWRDAQVSK